MIRVGSPEFMYMMEAEGHFKTRSDHIEDLIKETRTSYSMKRMFQAYDKNDLEMRYLLASFNLTDLTDEEWKYVKKSI